VELKMHEIHFSAGALPRTPLGELTTLPSPPNRLGRGNPLPISHPPSTPTASRSHSPC